MVSMCRVRSKKLMGMKNIDGDGHTQVLRLNSTRVASCKAHSCMPPQCRHVIVAVYALGFYVDTHAAKRELGREFGCLPPASLEHNQALAERAFPFMGLSSFGMLNPPARQTGGTSGACYWSHPQLAVHSACR